MRRRIDSRDVLRRAAVLAGVLGIFASTSSTGGLSIPWILEGAFVLSCILGVQAFCVPIAFRAAGARAQWQEIIVGYWASHTPWVVLLVALSLVAVMAPDHHVHRWFSMLGRAAIVGVLIAFAWSLTAKTSFARRTLRLSWTRSLLVMLVLTLIYLMAPLAFVIVTGQLPVPVLRAYL